MVSIIPGCFSLDLRSTYKKWKNLYLFFLFLGPIQDEVVGNAGEDGQETGSVGRLPSRLSILFAVRRRAMEHVQH